ncbi:hypothetical protein [Shewanella mangrovisoli]|uniref:hypothetical protein n=1 Tax=Shewanella mangrovisoli TaxID=2864211 RepID=UPI0035B7236D
MARAKLNQGEVAGIRLIADLFVIRELEKNVLGKNEHIKPHIKELEQRLKKSVPKVFAAEAELQKQISLVRAQWLRELEGLFDGK